MGWRPKKHLQNVDLIQPRFQAKNFVHHQDLKLLMTRAFHQRSRVAFLCNRHTTVHSDLTFVQAFNMWTPPWKKRKITATPALVHTWKQKNSQKSDVPFRSSTTPYKVTDHTTHFFYLLCNCTFWHHKLQAQPRKSRETNQAWPTAAQAQADRFRWGLAFVFGWWTCCFKWLSKQAGQSTISVQIINKQFSVKFRINKITMARELNIVKKIVTVPHGIGEGPWWWLNSSQPTEFIT